MASTSLSPNLIYRFSQVFVGIGATGWGILQQIYIAETTTIVARGLWSVLPDAIGVVVTMYSGTEIAQHMLDTYGTVSAHDDSGPTVVLIASVAQWMALGLRNVLHHHFRLYHTFHW